MTLHGPHKRPMKDGRGVPDNPLPSFLRQWAHSKVARHGVRHAPLSKGPADITHIFGLRRRQSKDSRSIEAVQPPTALQLLRRQQNCQLVTLPNEFARDIAQLDSSRGPQRWESIGYQGKLQGRVSALLPDDPVHIVSVTDDNAENLVAHIRSRVIID